MASARCHSLLLGFKSLLLGCGGYLLIFLIAFEIFLVVFFLALDLHTSELLFKVLELIKLNVRVIFLNTAFTVALVLTSLLEGGLNECLLSLSRLLTLDLSLFTLLGLSGDLDDLAILSADLGLAIVQALLNGRFLYDSHTSELLLELVDDIVVSVEIDLSSHFGVFFDILNEHVVILLVLGLVFSVSSLFLGVLLFGGILFEMLELPESVLLSGSELGIGLLHQDNGWYSDIFVIVHFVQLHQVDGVQVETEDSIVVVEGLAQVSVHDECLIVVTKVFNSDNLDLHHLEFLLEGSATDVNFMVGVFDVKHNELCQTVSAAESGEVVLPVGCLIDFIGAHGEHINNLHECGDLVYKHKGTKSSQFLGKLLGEQDEVVLTNGCNIHGEGIFLIEGVVLHIVRNELLALLEP